MEARGVSRRAFVRYGAAGVSLLLGEAMSPAQDLTPAVTAVDHLLLGAADLDHGIAWVEKITGVKPAPGGSHPGVGTRNALLSLGDRRYLEIIAPDPSQAAFNFQIDVRKLAGPRLITWAARTNDIAAVAKSAREAGYRLFGPRDGSRTTTEGRLLKWKTLGVLNKLGVMDVEAVPFFIEWAAESVHPSQDSPKGCELQSFHVEHPDPARVIEILNKLGLDARVSQAQTARLTATLQTPKGRVELN
jgi:hypothetical protein